MSQRVLGKFLSRGGRLLLFETQLINVGLCVLSTVYTRRLQIYFKSTHRNILGQTTVMVQDGLDIQELPAIVRKVSDAGLGTKSTNAKSKEVQNCDLTNIGTSIVPSELSNISEFNSIVEGLNRCFTVKEVLHLFSSIPEEEKTPKVALLTLTQIIELENNQSSRNQTTFRLKNTEEVALPNYLSRSATMNELVDTISSSSDMQILLDGLKTISRDVVGGSKPSYRQKLTEEALVRAADGKFSVHQICEVVKVFSTFKNVKNANDVDKLWVGIVDKNEEITEVNITELFQILPMFEQSRSMLLKILEKRILSVWWRLSGKTVADAMSVFLEVKSAPPRIMLIFSRWTNTNIHTVSEDDLTRIVRGFNALEYGDIGIEKALERYVKAKGFVVKNPAVLAAIMDYCAQFRIRSHHILQGCGEYFVEHGNSLPPLYIKSFFVPFGLLDYPPPNGIKFWKILEKVMDNKFIQFRPEDSLDLMLTCVYLEKHPVNFIKKIFNPYFLDRLHSTTDQNVLQLMRTKLKLFDTAMTLECPNYRGPLLPKDHTSKSLWQDGRVKRMANNILEPLTRIAGGADMLSASVVVGQLPTMGLYVIDILIHPRGMGTTMLPFNLRRDPNVYVAVLIHIPEHYCSEGKYLMGPQVMRKRHFRRLGLKVVDLEYSQLAKLKVHPQNLESYLVQKIKMAEKAL